MRETPRISDFEHGVHAAIDIVRGRAERCGNALDAHNLELEIRERCLRLPLMLRHDAARS